jgi:hypothetical protein
MYHLKYKDFLFGKFTNLPICKLLFELVLYCLHSKAVIQKEAEGI